MIQRPEMGGTVRVGIVGLGKMGVSHFAILNAHPGVRVTAVADTSGFLLSALKKHGQVETFKDYRRMIDAGAVDAVVIAVPTKLHAETARYALEHGLHVFVEKPFVLDLDEGALLVELAGRGRVVNQVGYHNRFIGTFVEAQRLIGLGAIGEVHHISGEAYGQVVVREQSSTWRSKKSQGSGCLHDYCSHVVDLMNYLVGPPQAVLGCALKRIYSESVEDAVYATLRYASGATGQISTNWSDEAYRKMTTQVAVFGSQGKIVVDRQECRLYLRKDADFSEFSAGWNVRYITELQNDVAFYLRGEEYTSQIDEFVGCIQSNRPQTRSSFRSALETDTIIHQLQLAGSREN